MHGDIVLAHRPADPLRSCFVDFIMIPLVDSLLLLL